MNQVLPPRGATRRRQAGHVKRLTPWIRYEIFQWTWFLVITILAIVDRFTWNVWPRQTYSTGADSAGDRWVQTWAVRGLWCCSMAWQGPLGGVFHHLLQLYFDHEIGKPGASVLANSFVGEYHLDTSNIINANLRLHYYHYWNGIGLCVTMTTLLHVWSILFVRHTRIFCCGDPKRA